MAVEMCENRLGGARVRGGGSGKRFEICKPTNEMDSKISCNQLDSYSDAASSQVTETTTKGQLSVVAPNSNAPQFTMLTK